MRKTTVCFALFCLLSCATAVAQRFAVEAAIDSSFIFIGEQAGLTLDVVQSKGERVHLPIVSDTIVKGVELIDRLEPDTTTLDNAIKVRHKFIITSFDTALYYIPPFVLYNESGDTVESNALSLKVFTLDIDTTQYELAAIKTVYEPPFNWKGFWRIVGYVVVALLLLGLIYWLVRRYAKRRAGAVSEAPVEERPAHIVALEQLDALRESKLWERGEPKNYYTALTDIIRTYVGRRYEVNAMESTSDEIIAMLKAQQLDKEHVGQLRQLFEVSDLVKFAKWQPMIDECFKSLNVAYDFVQSTKEEAVEEPTAKEQVKENNPNL